VFTQKVATALFAEKENIEHSKQLIPGKPFLKDSER
jgi:hypothetical protein